MDEVQTNIDGFQGFLDQIENFWISISTWVGQLFGADDMVGGVIITVIVLLGIIGGAIISFLNRVAGE